MLYHVQIEDQQSGKEPRGYFIINAFSVLTTNEQELQFSLSNKV
jgi:hypothetical protein